MSLVTSFAFLLQEFAVVMNVRTFENFWTLVAGMGVLPASPQHGTTVRAGKMVFGRPGSVCSRRCRHRNGRVLDIFAKTYECL